MAGKKKESAASQINPLGYMTTFSDLVTLLMTFFVLMITMSSMDNKAIKEAFGLFTGGSGPLAFTQDAKLQALSQIIDRSENIPSKMLLSQSEIKETVFQFQDVDYQKLMELVDRDITVTIDERGMVIQMADYILFEEGSAKLKMEYLPILNRLALVLRGMRYPISIEGHTSTGEIENPKDPQGWMLSLDRAIAVLEYFTTQEGLLEESFRVAGYGPSKPLYPNDTVENQARNRRIEIVLYKRRIG
ncbi:MAG: flagellar motor protein MotB [Proteobacteria bacterium]|nr:flagellar motor protein MotB [Pseudomonadota bacterium]